MINLNNKFLEEVAGDYVMRNWESRCFKVNNFYLPKKIVTLAWKEIEENY